MFQLWPLTMTAEGDSVGGTVTQKRLYYGVS